MDYSSNRYGIMMVCPECGKDFFCTNPGEWAYKRASHKGHGKIFCSWTCMRKHDRIAEEKAAARREADKRHHWHGRRKIT